MFYWSLSCLSSVTIGIPLRFLKWPLELMIVMVHNWFVHTNELKPPTFAKCPKAACLGANQPVRMKSVKVWMRKQKRLTKRMAGVGSAISVTPAVLFLRSLTELGLFLLSHSLPLSLFTFNPVLEVPCVLLVTFFREDLNLASFTINRKKTVIIW